MGNRSAVGQLGARPEGLTCLSSCYGGSHLHVSGKKFGIILTTWRVQHYHCFSQIRKLTLSEFENGQSHPPAH